MSSRRIPPTSNFVRLTQFTPVKKLPPTSFGRPPKTKEKDPTRQGRKRLIRQEHVPIQLGTISTSIRGNITGLTRTLSATPRTPEEKRTNELAQKSCIEALNTNVANLTKLKKLYIEERTEGNLKKAEKAEIGSIDWGSLQTSDIAWDSTLITQIMEGIAAWQELFQTFEILRRNKTNPMVDLIIGGELRTAFSRILENFEENNREEIRKYRQALWPCLEEAGLDVSKLMKVVKSKLDGDPTEPILNSHTENDAKDTTSFAAMASPSQARADAGPSSFVNEVGKDGNVEKHDVSGSEGGRDWSYLKKEWKRLKDIESDLHRVGYPNGPADAYLSVGWTGFIQHRSFKEVAAEIQKIQKILEMHRKILDMQGEIVKIGGRNHITELTVPVMGDSNGLLNTENGTTETHLTPQDDQLELEWDSLKREWRKQRSLRSTLLKTALLLGKGSSEKTIEPMREFFERFQTKTAVAEELRMRREKLNERLRVIELASKVGKEDPMVSERV